MSFNQLLKKIKESKAFKEFKKRHNETFLFSAFFTLDQEFAIETQQIDFYIPDKKKVKTFLVVEGKIKHKLDELKIQHEVTKLNENIKIDIPEIIEIIKKEIESQKLSAFKFNKAIIILQKQKNKQIWNITCFFNNFKMLRLHIDCLTEEILESKQGSILDFIQIKENK